MSKTGLKNIAYKYISDAIMSFEMKPGQVIVEQDLSAQLSISRTPIREALRQLELEGLVRHVVSRGTFVEYITVQDVEELFEIRMLLEMNALKRAIKEITDEELDDIEQRLIKLSDDRINDNIMKEQYFDTDRSLHLLIMMYSRNSRMITFHKNIEMQLERLRRISSMTDMRLSRSRYEHQAIISALRKRDLNVAAGALGVHLNNVKESTLNVCKNVWLDLQVSP